MTLYFAYGSNMGAEPMAARCPYARALGPVCARGWRFIITRAGYASIVSSPGRMLHGVLWCLTLRDLAKLNAYENIDNGLYRRDRLAVRHATRQVSALVYIACGGGRGRPDPGYQADIVAAARAWRFPARYVRELARWSPGGRPSPAAGRRA